MLKFIETQNEDIELSPLRNNELVKKLYEFTSEEEFKKVFYRKIFNLKRGTAILMAHNNKIMDYTDMPGNYFWYDESVKTTSIAHMRFLHDNIKSFEEKIQGILDKEHYYVYLVNVENKSSFPFYLETATPFQDRMFGEIYVRYYNSVDLIPVNPFLLVYKSIASNCECIDSYNLTKNDIDKISSCFVESIAVLNDKMQLEFDNITSWENEFQKIILPKLFACFYDGYGFAIKKINVNSVLPDAISRDIIESKEKNPQM